jgi:hypothetical protein
MKERLGAFGHRAGISIPTTACIITSQVRTSQATNIYVTVPVKAGKQDLSRYEALSGKSLQGLVQLCKRVTPKGYYDRRAGGTAFRTIPPTSR